MSTRPFVHLHCHSHYSLLDGAATIPRLLDRAKDHGMNALALTDHGNLHGALQFYQAAKKRGINPIIGYEAYIAPDSRFDKTSGKMKESSYHLTLLAQNRIGFQNLMQMSSAAYLEGFYFKPRIDRELLEQHQEGIICLSGCLSSEFSRVLLNGHGNDQNLDQAIEVAQWFHGVFGDRFFIEIMNNGVELQRMVTEGAVDVARQLGIPMVATNDVHYVDQADADAQDVMLCINTGRFRTDTTRMKMDGQEYYLRSQEEMYRSFDGLEEAVSRTQEIADSVDIDLKLGERHFPSFEPPKELSSMEYLRQLCLEGLRERYAGNEERLTEGELTSQVMERLEHELGVIDQLGFSDYFLICWDFVRQARDSGIPATARGSGVGALVCYALYLSHVCPLKFGLLFERFLDVSRREAPDIDIDFCKEHRGEIIRYVKQKYGESNVAQIGTFGTLAARAAIKDTGRVLGIPLSRVNQLTGMIPNELGISLKGALEKSDELAGEYKTDGEVRELLDVAMKIEGLARNLGTHAAAVVIGDKPLKEYLPLGKVTGKDDVITQWSMNDVEAAGLLKMDFLGLRNLTILRRSVDLVEQTTGERIDPQQFPMDDAETFALFCRGETKGIFQFESGGIRDLLQRMKPDSFHDIIATNALYRPGPLEGGMVDDYVAVKHGRKQAEYKHPVLEEILSETHGVMVYQEQVMRILNRFGDIDLAEAYTCIKAISKKKESTINKSRDQFFAGATERGLQRHEAEDLWFMITKFAGYGFNKSHSTAYAFIAYQTAYLKAHYPLEFMAALLSSDISGRNFKRKDSLVEHLEDCNRMGIEVVPPHVNTSGTEFTVENGKIYFALSAIKGCGGTAADAIVHNRVQDGPYRDLFDFCERVEPTTCGRAAIETLIKAGTFDDLGANRQQLAQIIERALQAGSAALSDRRSGQKNLFEQFNDDTNQEDELPLPNVPEFEERERLIMEKEVLGFYLSSHPLAEHRDLLASYSSHTTTRLSKLSDRTEVVIGGMISSITLAHTKNGRPGSPTKYANFDIEDVEGTVRCIMWPDSLQRFEPLLEPDSILLARGSVDRRGGGDEVNLIVDELISLDQLDDRCTKGMVIRVDELKHGDRMLPQIYEILRAYPGNQEVRLLLDLADGHRVSMKADRLQIQVSTELKQRMDDLLGNHNYQMITQFPKTP
ncbi:MAG TPA: DNA polymerase III subunit alpha [Planctomycetaceae bacterium]|nr:DNA polymerase III subunit alpha [Planctomycetaceae bacterium]